jgi:hypothetical protein
MAYFSWVQYAIFAFVYSVIPFSSGPAKDSPRVFSKQNMRAFPVLLLGHIAFLMILAVLMQITVRIGRMLPVWVTEPGFGRRNTTPLEGFFLLVVIALGLIEWLWVRVKLGNDAVPPENNNP